MNVELAYQTYRKLLFSIAYRLLGTVTEAEDVVQDVFVSLHAADPDSIDNMKAFLGRSVTNRCLNILQSASRRKETYPGPWLPEPLYGDSGSGSEPGGRIELEEDIGYAYLVMLERLSPLERVVFVLREAYGYEYEEIGDMIDKSPDNCRKILSRSRRKMSDAGYTEALPDERKQAIVLQFVAALRQGNIPEAINLLADQVVIVTDGGGKVKSALRPIAGIGRVGAFIRGIAAKETFSHGVAPVSVNGETAMALTRIHLPQAVWCFELDQASGKIVKIYAVNNPDKLIRKYKNV
ncbi:RNA polymerase sigma factor SigJ [Paenibacillus hemerocallicola]|nr:RNA polymerase sigma factor SigJ [Paenibacillus hemerocallicola]